MPRSSDTQKQTNVDSNESDNNSQRSVIDSTASGSNVDENVNIESKTLHLKRVFIN